MPSPFPGMDPYLEAPSIWPDLHQALASAIRAQLNVAMPGPYYARVEMRQEESGSLDVAFDLDPIRHQFVEIRDPSRGHRLVTLIEMLSPSNKRNGLDRIAYGRKQAEILESDASLVEIDLLRGGRRISPHAGLGQFLATISPNAVYVVLVNSAWRRGGLGLGYQVYPIGLRDALPCVGLPLKADEPAVPLDLQAIFDRIYDGGPYRRGAIDYSGSPEPPLSGEDAAWVEATLRPGRTVTG